jgi:hypothetical protein
LFPFALEHVLVGLLPPQKDNVSVAQGGAGLTDAVAIADPLDRLDCQELC